MHTPETRFMKTVVKFIFGAQPRRASYNRPFVMRELVLEFIFGAHPERQLFVAAGTGHRFVAA